MSETDNEAAYAALRSSVETRADPDEARKLKALAAARKDRGTFLLASRALGVFMAEDLTEALEGSNRAIARYLETLETNESLERLFWTSRETGQTHSGPGLLEEVFSSLDPKTQPSIQLQIQSHAVAVNLPDALLLHFLADIVERLSKGLPSSKSRPFTAQAVQLARSAATAPSKAASRHARFLVDEIFPQQDQDRLSCLAKSLAEAVSSDVVAYVWQDVVGSLAATGWNADPFLWQAYTHFIRGLIASLKLLGDDPASATEFEELTALASALHGCGLPTTSIDLLRPLYMRPWGVDRLGGPPVGITPEMWPRDPQLPRHFKSMVGRLYRGLRRPQLEELSRAFDGDTRLDHLTTLELGRLVLRGLPSDTAAVSVYLGFTAFNEVTTPGDARARVLLLSDSELTRPSAGELPADIPKSFGKSLALRRQGPFMGMIRTPLEVPTAAFDQALEQPSGQTLQDLTRLRSLLTQSSYIGGGPLFLKAPMHDDGDFVMQLHEALFDESADFGGDGVLYVFSDTAFTQRP